MKNIGRHVNMVGPALPHNPIDDDEVAIGCAVQWAPLPRVQRCDVDLGVAVRIAAEPLDYAAVRQLPQRARRGLTERGEYPGGLLCAIASRFTHGHFPLRTSPTNALIVASIARNSSMSLTWSMTRICISRSAAPAY